MIRKSLFRAKILYEDDWAEGYFIPEIKESLEGKTVESGFLRVHRYAKDGSVIAETVEIDRTTLCEFTGLYDKNKTKIFEGAILKDILGEKYAVKYFEDFACFFAYRGTQKFFIKDLVGAEVVGNAYDNLKKENVVLSGSSKHLPTYKECMRCKFSNQCNSGNKCVVALKTGGDENEQ